MVRPVSDIYWGSGDGYSPRRTTQLPTRFARDVAIADLNRDRTPDLVFAVQDYKGEPGGVLVYWGSESGYSADASLWLEGLGSVAVVAADLNMDGWPDLAVANQTAPGIDGDSGGIAVTPIPCYVYWGASEGFDAARRTELPAGGPVGSMPPISTRTGIPISSCRTRQALRPSSTGARPAGTGPI